MIASLLKALGQLSDPPVRRVVVRSFLMSLVLFAALVAAATWALANISSFGIGWLDSLLAGLGGVAAFVVGLILFPGFATVIVGFFLDEIVDAVERRHYPDLPPARHQPVWETATTVARLLAVTVVLNLIVLPLYFVPLVNLFVFYGLNGYLLGREYFELVALRRSDTGRARKLRKASRWRVLVAGIVITVLLSVPVVGWIMPVVGAAFMVHVLAGLMRRETESKSMT